MRNLRPFLFLIAIVKLKTSLEETVVPAPIFISFPTCLYCSPVEILGKILSILKSVEIDCFSYWGKNFPLEQRLFGFFFLNFKIKKAWSHQTKQKSHEVCLQQCFYMQLFACFVKKILSRWWFFKCFPLH